MPKIPDLRLAKALEEWQTMMGDWPDCLEAGNHPDATQRRKLQLAAARLDSISSQMGEGSGHFQAFVSSLMAYLGPAYGQEQSADLLPPKPTRERLQELFAASYSQYQRLSILCDDMAAQATGDTDTTPDTDDSGGEQAPFTYGTYKDIAKHFGIDKNALRKRLTRRFRNVKDAIARGTMIENEDRGKHEPRYLYRVADIRDCIHELKS